MPTRSLVGSSSPSPLVVHDVGDRAEDRERGRQQHRDRRGVRHEGREQARDEAERDDRAHGALADAGHGQHAEREAARDPVAQHRLGEDERADEDEDGRRAERRDHVVDRCDADHHDQRDPEQAADRDRHRLGDPQHDDEQQRGGELLLVAVHVERQQQEDQEDRGRQEQPDRAPRLLEALLLRAQLLLAERPVRPDLGEALQRVAVRLLLPRCHAQAVPRVSRL